MILSLLLATTLTARTNKVMHQYEASESKKLVPMLSEVLRFPTYKGNDAAIKSQQEWLAKTAHALGFVTRDAGHITEIELPGPEGAPVLGLVIHGDVQPVDASHWSIPPFEGKVQDGYVLGRGAADDKGPLVQALLAMHALAASGVKRTHTIRLLVGSQEESDAAEMGEYLKTHVPPDYSLVLDSEFPVVVGEKAWDGLAISTTLTERPGVSAPYAVESLDAGLAPSIVPDIAAITLRWRDGVPNWKPLTSELRAKPMQDGTSLELFAVGEELRVIVHGKSAHAGVNISGGRNALVAMARLFDDLLPSGGADDLLAFARLAGQDTYGTGLGLTQADPLWGRYAVNVATIKPLDDKTGYELFINLRRTPPRTGPESKAYLTTIVDDFNKRTGASLRFDDEQSYFKDEPLAFDPNGALVTRLMAIYSRATGEHPKPAISGGGTYAKRLPNAIAFGMWFPGKPYPGHDVDEKIPISDLDRGARVLVHALTDIATGAKIGKPF
jgi:succinyl-diaminopimelate desuccinylase